MFCTGKCGSLSLKSLSGSVLTCPSSPPRNCLLHVIPCCFQKVSLEICATVYVPYRKYCEWIYVLDFWHWLHSQWTMVTCQYMAGWPHQAGMPPQGWGKDVHWPAVAEVWDFRTEENRTRPMSPLHVFCIKNWNSSFKILKIFQNIENMSKYWHFFPV